MLVGTYTSFVTCRFVYEALLWPALEMLCTFGWAVARLIQAVPSLYTLPLAIATRLGAVCIREYRAMSWRRQAIYMLALLIFVSYRVLRFLSNFASWVHGWPWWCAPSKLLMYTATVLPVIIPSAINGWRLGQSLSIKAFAAMCNMGDKPVVLPSFVHHPQPVPKIWLWQAYLKLTRIYRAPLSGQLFQCAVCFVCVHSFTAQHQDPDLLRGGLPAPVPNSTLFSDTPSNASAKSHSLWSAAAPMFHASSAGTDEDAQLARCTAKNTPRFVPDVRRGKVTSVYDGDTLTIAARHSQQGPAYLFSVRLEGIDTPEIRGASSEGEKRAALAARDALR